MKNIYLATLAAVTFMLCLVDFTWTPNSNHTVMFHGVIGGIVILVIIGLILIYRSFLALQDYFIRAGRLASRVKTPYDWLPLILLIPLLPTYIWRSDAFKLIWGPENKVWLYFSLLIVIFLYQVYLLITTLKGKEK